jgi:hypothetical protein
MLEHLIWWQHQHWSFFLGQELKVLNDKMKQKKMKQKGLQMCTKTVFLLICCLIALTSAWKFLFTGTRRSLMLKYCAALSYAECADSGMILCLGRKSLTLTTCRPGINKKKTRCLKLAYISGLLIPFLAFI